MAQAHAWGVRHLQLIHFIQSPLGDRQTAEPVHGGLTPLGAKVVAECKRLGILVDLAHGTPALVDGVLQASDAAPVWSHSWISPQGGRWSDPGYIARSLSPATACTVADQCFAAQRSPSQPPRPAPVSTATINITTRSSPPRM